MSLLVDVFVNVWEILFEKKSEVGKLLEGMGFEPASLGIRSAVTDCSATIDTGSEGCCWFLMDVVGLFVFVWVLLAWLVCMCLVE